MDHRIVPVAEAEQQLGQLQVSAWQLGGRCALTSQADGHPQIGDRGNDAAGVKAERSPHDEQVGVGRGDRLGRLGQPFGQPGQASWRPHGRWLLPPPAQTTPPARSRRQPVARESANRPASIACVARP